MSKATTNAMIKFWDGNQTGSNSKGLILVEDEDPIDWLDYLLQ